MVDHELVIDRPVDFSSSCRKCTKILEKVSFCTWYQSLAHIPCISTKHRLEILNDYRINIIMVIKDLICMYIISKSVFRKSLGFCLKISSKDMLNIVYTLNFGPRSSSFFCWTSCFSFDLGHVITGLNSVLVLGLNLIYSGTFVVATKLVLVGISTPSWNNHCSLLD